MLTAWDAVALGLRYSGGPGDAGCPAWFGDADCSALPAGKKKRGSRVPGRCWSGSSRTRIVRPLVQVAAGVRNISGVHAHPSRQHGAVSPVHDSRAARLVQRRAVVSLPDWRTPRGPLLRRSHVHGPDRVASTLACIHPAPLNSVQLPSSRDRCVQYLTGSEGVGCRRPESAELFRASC